MLTLEKNVLFIYTIGVPGTSQTSEEPLGKSRESLKDQDFNQLARKSNGSRKIKNYKGSSRKSKAHWGTSHILHGRGITEVQATSGLLLRASRGLSDVD